MGAVTHIIHNAWTVNFNHPLGTFESQIAGVRHVADLLASMTRPVRLLFTSSVGAASGWDTQRGPVPEVPLDDPEAAAGTGYAASKYVVEQVCTCLYSDERCTYNNDTDFGERCRSRFGPDVSPYGTGLWPKVYRRVGNYRVVPHPRKIQRRTRVSASNRRGMCLVL